MLEGRYTGNHFSKIRKDNLRPHFGVIKRFPPLEGAKGEAIYNSMIYKTLRLVI